MCPMWITASKADEISALQGLDTEARAQLADDADRVQNYVARNQFITDEDLRAYGERNDLPADRLNAALAFLQETEQLVQLGGPAPADESASSG